MLMELMQLVELNTHTTVVTHGELEFFVENNVVYVRREGKLIETFVIGSYPNFYIINSLLRLTQPFCQKMIGLIVNDEEFIFFNSPTEPHLFRCDKKIESKNISDDYVSEIVKFNYGLVGDLFSYMDGGECVINTVDMEHVYDMYIREGNY